MNLKVVFLIPMLILASACSDETTTPTKYGIVEGSVAIESLEKSPDNITGDTLSIIDVDSIKVFLDGTGGPFYTSKGDYSISKVPYGTHHVTSGMIPGIENPSISFVLDSERLVLSDTIIYPYKQDSNPALVEFRHTIPNPFDVSNMTSFYVKDNIAVDVYVYKATGSEVKHLWHQEVLAGTYTLTWDGRDNQGIQCEPGIYFFVVFGDGEYCSYATMIKE